MPNGGVDQVRAGLLFPKGSVDLVVAGLPDLGSLLSDPARLGDSICVFPDGGLLVRTDRDDESLARHVHALISSKWEILSVVSGCPIRRLAPFGAHLSYDLMYREFRDPVSGKRHPLLLHPNSWTPVDTDSEAKLNNLSLAVKFESLPSSQVVEHFMQLVRYWSDSVSETGVFGEGPAFLATPLIEFRELCAFVRLDASRSGPETLNWLMMLLADFGFDIHSVKAIRYDHENHPGFLRVFRVSGPSVHISIQPETNVAAGLPNEGGVTQVLFSHVPPHAKPHPTFASQSFRVLESSRCFWEDFTMTVYFATTPTSEEQSQFREWIRAWIQLGQFGGYGGRAPIGFHGDVTFEPETRSARFWADLGKTDIEIAMLVLLRALESFSSLVGIDAVTIGGGDDEPDDEVG